MLKKGGKKENVNDWVQVFRKQDYVFEAWKNPDGTEIQPGDNYYHQSTVATYIARKGDTVYDSDAHEGWNLLILDEDNWPVIDNLGELELDSQNRPIVKVISGASTWYSDEDLGETDEGQHFKVIERSRKDGIDTIIIRISDNYTPDYELEYADGEFAISYRK